MSTVSLSAPMTPISGFGEVAAVAAWVQHLGGLARLGGFQAEGRSEFIRAASEPLPPAPPFMIPRVLSPEEATPYVDQAPKELQCYLSFMAAFQCGDSYVIAKELDLISALMFLTQADTDHEYAIEKDPSGRYLVVMGEKEFVIRSGDLLMHTHQVGIALPSEFDLMGMEERAVRGERHWELIYSTPPDEHQLAFIHRVLPRVFKVSFWRDRLDRERNERRTSARNFLIRTVHDPELDGDEFVISSLVVRERLFQGRMIGPWAYGPGTHPDRKIQNFWKDVIASRGNEASPWSRRPSPGSSSSPPGCDPDAG